VVEARLDPESDAGAALAEGPSLPFCQLREQWYVRARTADFLSVSSPAKASTYIRVSFLARGFVVKMWI
jgi:hypothetical protein